MTRNNLAEHLSWLLNEAHPQPTTTPFPSLSDASQSGFSQSQPSYSQGRHSSTSTSTPSSGTESRSRQTGDASNSLNGIGDLGAGLWEADQVTSEDEAMARLMSSSKSTKPRLVSKPRQQQLLTPTSLDPNRSNQESTRTRVDTSKL